MSSVPSSHLFPEKPNGCSYHYVCPVMWIPFTEKKSSSQPYRAGFRKMPLPPRPWDWISTGITGFFPTSDSGNKYIVVVICGFSKQVEAFPITNQEMMTVAQVLTRELFCRYGGRARHSFGSGPRFLKSFIQVSLFVYWGLRECRLHRSHTRKFVGIWTSIGRGSLQVQILLWQNVYSFL